MEYRTLTIRAQRQLSMSEHWGWFHGANTFHFLVLLYTLFCLTACEPCSLNGLQNAVDYDACGSYRDNYNAGFQDSFVGDVSSGHVSDDSLAHLSLDNVCTNLNSFCFPSTLPGFFSEKHKPISTIPEVSGVQYDAALPVGSTRARNNLSWSSDYGMFKLLSGRAVYCSLNSQEGIHDISSLQTSSAFQNDVSTCIGPLLNQKTPSYNLNENSETIKLGFSDSSLSPHVEIGPPLLDWGQKYLYFPSLAFLTVANTHSDNILNVYEPFSTNTQFYPCNFSEILLGPGEVASICFVFLPTWLGLSSAHLILQTSYGGFLIQAKGFGIESPYGIRPLVGLDVSSSGRWSRNLSLFNPFDETLYVEEVTAWITVSLANTSHSTKAICSTQDFQGSDQHRLLGGKEWLDVKSGQVGSSIMAMRPHQNWEIHPGSTETIIEIDFSYNFEGKIFGAFCMKLQSSSHDKIDMVMVPLEAEMGGNSAYCDLKNSIAVSLEILVPCDGSETVVVALSLSNAAPYILNVAKISRIGESTEVFQIKYVEGLILFPGTITRVAVITYTPISIELHDPPSEIPNTNMNCKLIVLTNDSSNPQIEIPCEDVVSICSGHRINPDIGYEQQSEKVEYDNVRPRSLDSSMQSPSQIKVLEMAGADELVLGNWKSQGTASGMSVLDDQELLFPMVQVGTHCSKWITVKNPSQQPVVMQLILNSGQIIDECRVPDGVLQPFSSSSLVHSEYTAPTRYGFSLAENALTEAYVHPNDRASFGPIFFHPSNRCEWRSSVLIRNNLSGVESLSLRGFGGSLSLVMFEGSLPVQSLEFKLNLAGRLNLSAPDIMENTTYTCSLPLSKELYAKNTGDLLLEIKKIEVSGTECGLDGFIVHTCKGFSLEPGESTKLLISYQTDFSAAMIQRDLELALATGILVIPMKASLPRHMLNFCRNSMFWIRLKKFSVAILVSASIMFLVFCCFLFQAMALGSQDYLFKGGKSSFATIRHAGKSSRVHRNQKNSNNFAVSSEMNDLLRSTGEEESSMLESHRYPDGQIFAMEPGMNAQHVNPALGNQRLTNCSSDTPKQTALPSCMLSKSLAVESSVLQEAPQPGVLTVRIGKEKGRRRRKKKSSGSVLTGLFEVSSSQSGNSTPSSPLSPVTSFLPKRLRPQSPDVDQSVEARCPFMQMSTQHCEKISASEPPSSANILESEVPKKYCNDNWFFLTQEKPSAPRKMCGKPVLLPSATFPCTGRSAPNLTCSPPFMASRPTIAPHARAPGSKLDNKKTVKTEEETGLEDQFKYDIWGDHLFGLQLTGKPKDVSGVTSCSSGCGSDSFFVRGPQIPVTKSLSTSVSCSHQDDL